jgi:spermidine synthase
MKKLERLAETCAPDGTVLTLYRRDRDYSIQVEGVELMSTRRHHSEVMLAELACAPVRGMRQGRVLIGGLGFGYTLRAALQIVAPDATVVVAELVQGVIDWNRNPELDLAGDALSDERVELLRDDVINVLGVNPAGFDVIMLDVDNGADALTASANAQLYRDRGIRTTITALRSGGRLGYWSDREDAPFERSLRHAGLSVETRRVRAHPTSGPWHTLYIAQRGA